MYKDKNYRGKGCIDKEVKGGRVVQQSKVFKFIIKSFYERSKDTGRRKFEGKRLNGSGWEKKQYLPRGWSIKNTERFRRE